LLFQRCSSAWVTRFPVRYRTVSSAVRQYVCRTSTSTPSTSKIRISGESLTVCLDWDFGTSGYDPFFGLSIVVLTAVLRLHRATIYLACSESTPSRNVTFSPKSLMAAPAGFVFLG